MDERSQCTDANLQTPPSLAISSSTAEVFITFEIIDYAGEKNSLDLPSIPGEITAPFPPVSTETRFKKQEPPSQ